MRTGKAEMPFAIVADLPLGTYHGAGQDGQPEPMPSRIRLTVIVGRSTAARGRAR